MAGRSVDRQACGWTEEEVVRQAGCLPSGGQGSAGQGACRRGFEDGKGVGWAGAVALRQPRRVDEALLLAAAPSANFPHARPRASR